MALAIAMSGRRKSILLSLMLICAILTGCLSEKESVEELDEDVLLELWVFTTNHTSNIDENEYVEEMSDGDTVFFEYPALMPTDYLLLDGFSITVRCDDGIYAENGMPIPINEEDTLTFIIRAGNGEVLHDENDFPCDNEDKTRYLMDYGEMEERYWTFMNDYATNGVYHSADEAFGDLDLPQYESIYPITIEITAQTAGEIPGVSEDNSLEVSLTNIYYIREDPSARFWSMCNDECESMLGHEH